MSKIAKEMTKNETESNVRRAHPYRKNPDAPKRFRSPFILFSKAKLGELKEQNGSVTPLTKMAKQVAKQWNEISTTKERDHWEEEARKDKLRYYHEKETYKGPWRILNKRAKKDPDAPKRPMSAFLHYAQKERSVLRQKDPTLTFSQISKNLAEKWKILPDELRAPHLQWELKERAIYNKKVAEYKSKKEQEHKLREKKAQEMAIFKNSLSQQIKSVPTSLPLAASLEPFQSASNRCEAQNMRKESTVGSNEKIANSHHGLPQSGQFSKKQYESATSSNSSKPWCNSFATHTNVVKFKIGAEAKQNLKFNFHEGITSPISKVKRCKTFSSWTPILAPSSRSLNVISEHLFKQDNLPQLQASNNAQIKKNTSDGIPPFLWCSSNENLKKTIQQEDEVRCRDDDEDFEPNRICFESNIHNVRREHGRENQRDSFSEEDSFHIEQGSCQRDIEENENCCLYRDQMIPELSNEQDYDGGSQHICIPDDGCLSIEPLDLRDTESESVDDTILLNFANDFFLQSKKCSWM